MTAKRHSGKRRRRIFRIKMICTVTAFLLVLAMTVALILYRNESFDTVTQLPDEDLPSSSDTQTEIPDTDEPEAEDSVTDNQPVYPPSEPVYEPLFGEEYSTFRLPRKTVEYEFVETLMEIAFNEPVEAEDKKGVTKYGAYFGTPKYEWCTEFVIWCIVQAQEKLGLQYTDVNYPFSDWSGGCVSWYRSKGLFFKRSSGYVPRRGDMIFFDYDYDGSTDHTGLVYGVEYDAQEDKIYILTIEGNLPEDYPVGSIKQRRLACDWKKIYGYGTFMFIE